MLAETLTLEDQVFLAEETKSSVKGVKEVLAV